MKKLSDIVAYIFIAALALLTIITIFGIWDFISKDVISKSFQSIGLLALVSIIILIADNFLDKERTESKIIIDPQTGNEMVVSGNLSFQVIRNSSIVILIISAVFLALIAVLSIWEILNETILSKSVSTIGVIAFSTLIAVVTCLNRENHPILKKQSVSPLIGAGFLILGLWFLSIILSEIF
jgi:hypothetical protein